MSKQILCLKGVKPYSYIFISPLCDVTSLQPLIGVHLHHDHLAIRRKTSVLYFTFGTLSCSTELCQYNNLMHQLYKFHRVLREKTTV